MRLSLCMGAVLLGVAASAGGLVSWRQWRAGGLDPGVLEAAPAGFGEEHAEGRVLFGFVQASAIDPCRWKVLATPLSLAACGEVRSADLNTRGRFVLSGLADMDYRVELVAEGSPPEILARADYVRPGRDELVLEIDPLQLARLAVATR